MRRKFFRQRRSAALQKKLFATRYSLSSRLGRSLALPFHSALILRPTPRSVFVPCTMSPAPLKLMRVDELWKMRYGFMGKTQIDG